ncbi:MAG: polymer-forming cytoskeletal protein [Hyphomicrobium sp.]|jgi:cytoskeletal protein CcmA (bactofilin family)
MVFNRKPDPIPVPADVVAPQMRRLERPNGIEKQHLQALGSTSTQQSVIGNDLSIEGQTITIRCKGSLKVHGNIQADLHSRELEVGKEAVIQGSIAADTVDVYGRVSGAIHGAHVVLHAGAEVEGDIHSHLLSIEQGAAFDGRSRRVLNPAEIAPQLERPQQNAPSASQFGAAPPHHS